MYSRLEDMMVWEVTYLESQTLIWPPSLQEKQQPSAISSFFLLLFFFTIFAAKTFETQERWSRNERVKKEEVPTL